MRRKALTLGASLVLTASLAAPAVAQTVCAGTANTAVVCANPTGGAPIEDCIYVGPPPCTPVSVPTPTVSCGGDLITRICLAIRYLSIS